MHFLKSSASFFSFHHGCTLPGFWNANLLYCITADICTAWHNSADQCTKHTWTTITVFDVFIATHILRAFSVLSIAENTLHVSVITPDQQYKQNTKYMDTFGQHYQWCIMYWTSHRRFKYSNNYQHFLKISHMYKSTTNCQVFLMRESM